MLAGAWILSRSWWVASVAIAALVLAWPTRAWAQQCPTAGDICLVNECSCPPGKVVNASSCSCVASTPPPQPTTQPTVPPPPLPVPRCTLPASACGACQRLDPVACRCVDRFASDEACWREQCRPARPAHPALCKQLGDRLAASDLSAALSYYDKACNADHGPACAELGSRYARAGEAARAAGYHEKACDHGVDASCAQAAELYRRSGNAAKATTLLRKACDRGSASACDATGNAAKARTLYQEACNHNDYEACERAGGMQARGVGGPVDRVRAQASLAKACHQGGRSEGCYQLGLLLGSGGSARDSHDKACQKGHLAACEAVGDILLEGRGVPMNKPGARVAYEKACAEGRLGGRGRACFLVGKMHDSRDRGKGTELQKARTYYDHACRRGVADGCRHRDQVDALLGDDDKDGVPNIDDLCPTEAEDKDGFQDDDGCPEDNDGDGIDDIDDHCKNHAETVNGVQDDDGCPEGSLALTVYCGEDADPVDFDDLTVTRGGAELQRRKERFLLLDPGLASLKVEASGCAAADVALEFRLEQPEMSETVHLERSFGGKLIHFEGKMAKMPSERTWQLGLTYHHTFLPPGTAFTAADGSGDGVTLDEAAGLHGAMVTAGASYDHVVALLDFGYARSFAQAGRLEQGGAAEVTLEQITFPSLRLGGRLPFGWGALVAGNTTGLTHWLVDATAGNTRNLTNLDFGPWGALELKPHCDIGTTVSGGYKWAFGLDGDAAVPHGWLNAGLLYQPCVDTGDNLFDRGRVPHGKLAADLRLSYAHVRLPRDVAFLQESETGERRGVYTTGNQVLHGGTLSAGLTYENLTLGVDFGFAVGSAPVKGIERTGTTGEAPAGSAPAEVDISVLTLPSFRLGPRWPFETGAIEGGLSVGASHWSLSSGDVEHDGLTLFDFGMWAGVQLKPACDVGASLTGAYKFGTGTGEAVGFNHATLEAGLFLQPCEDSDLFDSDATSDDDGVPRLSFTYTQRILPSNAAFELEVEDSEDSFYGVYLRGGQVLHGATASFGLSASYLFVSADLSVARGTSLPLDRVVRNPSVESQNFSQPTATTADITHFSFPAVRLGGRVPFGFGSFQLGGNLGQSHWLPTVEGELTESLTHFDLGLWGGADIKPTCNVGLTVNGGYNFGAAPGRSAPFNHGHFSAGLLIEPCDDSEFLSDNHTKPDGVGFTVGYQHLVSQAMELELENDDEATYGLYFEGLNTLHGVFLAVAPDLDHLVLQLQAGFARGTNLRVDRFVPDPAEGAEVPFDAELTADLTVLTLPGGRIGGRVGAKSVTLLGGAEVAIFHYLPSVEGYETDNDMVIGLGLWSGLEFKPTCLFGMSLTGGYNLGIGGPTLGQIQAGAVFQPCDE